MTDRGFRAVGKLPHLWYARRRIVHYLSSKDSPALDWRARQMASLVAWIGSSLRDALENAALAVVGEGDLDSLTFDETFELGRGRWLE
jgi:hypothetical protein